MSVAAAVEMARSGRLYPAVILHGGADPDRREATQRIARALLCERQAEERPCGECRHCRRITTATDEERFHPDFHLLERDQKTVTSIDATRRFLQAAQMAPFEARGQVFVIVAAETLGPDAADTLLKILEEPPPRTPRNFLLLAPSSRELSSTLRSRSMSLYLGGEADVQEGLTESLAEAFAASLSAFLESGVTVHLLAAAAALERAGDWRDLRAGAPWVVAATAVMRTSRRPDLAAGVRRALLDLAAALLEARGHRLRGIGPQRILEGLVVRHLGGLATAPTGVVAGV